MVAKSVIEIDVNDSKFKSFQAVFDKYQKALSDLPKKWSQANDAMAKTVTKQDAMLHALNTIAKSLNANFEKLEVTTENLGKKQKNNNKELKDAVYYSAGFARNMASAALSAAKWVAFGAIGGGFGLGGIAASASDYRRQAQGLGISTGQLRAANIGFGRYINPEATLGNIAEIQSDVSRRQILARLGAQPGQNAAQNLPAIIQNAIGQFKAGGQSKQFAEALGLTQVFSLEELRRLASLNEQELQKVIAQYQKDAKALEVSDEDSRKWQDFWVALKKAGNTIETSIIKNLAKFTPELEKLSNAVAEAIDAFLSSKQFKDALDDFIGYINSPEGKQAISDFFEGLKMVAEFIGKTFGAIPEVKRGLTIAGQNLFSGGASTHQALNAYMKAGFNKTQAIGMVATLYGESNLDPDVYGKGEEAKGQKSEAYGIGQWHPDRQALFKKWYGKDIHGSSLADQIQFSIDELTHTEQKALRQFQNVKEGDLQGAVSAGLSYERPANRERELVRRTEIANSIDVKVFNNTGGNANATVSAMPGVSR